MSTAPSRDTASAPHPIYERVEDAGPSPWVSPLFQELAMNVRRRIEGTAVPAHALAPSPSGGDPLLGHMRGVMQDPLTTLHRWRAEVGDIIRLRMVGVTAHLVCHPDQVGFVLSGSNRLFTRPMQGRRALFRILGNGLLVSEGKFWLRQRRIAQPAFHRRRIHTLGARMVEAALDLEKEWLARADRDEEFDLARDMNRVTLRIVQETLLGAAPTADADAIAEAVTVVIDETNKRMGRLLHLPESIPLAGNRRFVKHRDVLDAQVHRMIRERREGGPQDDLLSMLLETRDADTGEGMSDRQLRDEVMTVFLAGHETTANALSFAFYLLGKHPHVAQKLREELDQVLGDRDPSADDYPALKYTQMVVREAMRLYPPAWIIARSPLTDVELEGYTIPALSRVFISPWVTHRHPGIWRDPEVFDPERFRDPKAIDRFAYFPFGGGPRICIGNAFAMMEAVLIVATLMRRMRVELAPGHQVVPEAMVTLRPKHGVRVVTRRI